MVKWICFHFGGLNVPFHTVACHPVYGPEDIFANEKHNSLAYLFQSDTEIHGMYLLNTLNIECIHSISCVFNLQC